MSKKNSSEANKGGTVTQQPGGEEGMGQPLVKTASKDRGESVSSELSDRASVSSWSVFIHSKNHYILPFHKR